MCWHFLCTVYALHFGGRQMAEQQRSQNDMPDVPKLDFVGALCEMWFGVSYAAYHLAYVRVYLQTAALQTDVDQIRKQEQAFRDMTQVSATACSMKCSLSSPGFKCHRSKMISTPLSPWSRSANLVTHSRWSGPSQE